MNVVETERLAMHREYWKRKRRKAFWGAVILGGIGCLAGPAVGLTIAVLWFALVMLKGAISAYFKGVDRTVRS